MFSPQNGDNNMTGMDLFNPIILDYEHIYGEICENKFRQKTYPALLSQ